MVLLSVAFQLGFIFNKVMVCSRYGESKWGLDRFAKPRIGVNIKGSCGDGDDNDHVWFYL